MTDAHDDTPSRNHNPSINFQPDYDDYGLHEQESATTIIRIDHDTGLFERIGKAESISTGVILKEHTRLTDDVADDITKTYTPIQFVSARTDGFESRVEEAIFEFVYDETVSEELAEQLSRDLAENFSNRVNGFSPHNYDE